MASLMDCSWLLPDSPRRQRERTVTHKGQLLLPYGPWQRRKETGERRCGCAGRGAWPRLCVGCHGTGAGVIQTVIQTGRDAESQRQVEQTVGGDEEVDEEIGGEGVRWSLSGTVDRNQMCLIISVLKIHFVPLQLFIHIKYTVSWRYNDHGHSLYLCVNLLMLQTIRRRTKHTLQCPHLTV